MSAPQRPMVVELVGPAGVGKTTLANRLAARGHAVRGTIWEVPKPVLVHGTLRQLPTAFTLYRETGRFLWNEIKHLARLEGLRTVLRTTHWNGTRLVLLDEGPVFTLGWLQVIGHRRFAYGPPAEFLRPTLERWARSLDAVVVLDASDDVLITRIKERAKPHPMKDRSSLELAAFIQAYRVATERVLADLQTLGGGGGRPPVIRLSCGRDDPLDARVVEALEQRAAHAR